MKQKDVPVIDDQTEKLEEIYSFYQDQARKLYAKCIADKKGYEALLIQGEPPYSTIERILRGLSGFSQALESGLTRPLRRAAAPLIVYRTDSGSVFGQWEGEIDRKTDFLSTCSYNLGLMGEIRHELADVISSIFISGLFTREFDVPSFRTEIESLERIKLHLSAGTVEPYLEYLRERNKG